MSDSQPKISTLALHAGQHPDSETKARALPIYQTTSFVFENTDEAAAVFGLAKMGNIYTRLNNPTNDALEQRLTAIEGGIGALATSSGMSAIFLAVTNILQAGDHMITSAALYGGTDTLFRFTLKRFGIEVTFVKDFTPENIAKEIRDNTKLIYFETIANPSGDIPDIESVTTLAHANHIPVMVDNTFAPGISQLFQWGVDIIVYSCTKWLGGHGTSIGGAIVDSGKFDWTSGRFPEFTTPDESYHGLILADLGAPAFILKARVQGLRNIGPCLSPYNAFMIVQGIETLPLRMKAHCSNALKVAEFLQSHPKVEKVIFTGLPSHASHANATKYLTQGCFGSVLGVEIKGGELEARKFIDHTKLASHLANVGDAKTLIIHPSSTTHQQLTEEAKLACGVTPGFVRISVGIEDVEDIIADFKQALDAE